MRSQRSMHLVFAAVLSLLLAGCGGGGGGDGFTGGGSGTGSGGSGGGGGGGTTTGPRLGVLDGTTFTPGIIDIGLVSLSAGGSSGLRVNLVDTANNNQLITEDVSITFSSPCASGGTSSLATITPATVQTATGTANATYRAQGCSGTDLITASATVGGVTVQATGTIEVEAAPLGAIEFVSAVPASIALRGTGGTEISTVTFRVTNTSGGPVANQVVNFTLDTDAGGIELSGSPGTTSGDGLVSATVRAGTVATVVRVTATAVLDGTTVSSQSSQLAITTGVPDQNSFSLSAECFNVEGLNIDGTEVPVTIRASDRYNNPVPDGTAVVFTTEGGDIEPSCVTAGGACTVIWESQKPRPLALNGCANGTDANCSVIGVNGASRAGRSTVLATAIGEESFTDSDADGLYDVGEPFGDLDEAFVDNDEDRARDTSPHVEVFSDFNRSFNFDLADGQFNGLLCDLTSSGTPAACANPKNLHVRDSLTIIMSGSAPAIDDSTDVSVGAPGLYDGAGTVTVPSGSSTLIGVVVRDVNDQPMPQGTAIDFSVDEGTLSDPSSFTVPCTTNDTASGNRRSVRFKAPDLEATDSPGFAGLTLKVTTPSGLESFYSLNIIITPPPPPP